MSDNIKEKKENTDRLLWIDMETTGLDPDMDRIMEVAMVVTDNDLNIISTFDSVAAYVPKERLDNMSPWCVDTHGKSGLTDRCANSNVGIHTLHNDMVDFTIKHFGDSKVVIAGNSIHFDRKFIDIHLPTFASMLHYRMLDVSSFKLLLTRKYPALSKYNKENTHTAFSDIMESIGEMRHYMGFITPPVVTMEDIKELALANGFKLKEQPNGTMDLNPYVYDFAKALLSKVKLSNGVSKVTPLAGKNYWDGSKSMVNEVDFEIYKDKEL